ncbi:hypothetical protein [Paenibacillus xerothermodurans]|uniref:hypothetical protein n=1 Tax=Paenibacillus xerothermodurans TaxID=1977292 RepID=UPI00140258DB|nr:hypothetical protein [Paenibacillus xerothermodurans]
MPSENMRQQKTEAERQTESPEQQRKRQKGQSIEPQAEKWNTQHPPDRDKKSPN